MVRSARFVRSGTDLVNIVSIFYSRHMLPASRSPVAARDLLKSGGVMTSPTVCIPCAHVDEARETAGPGDIGVGWRKDRESSSRDSVLR